MFIKKQANLHKNPEYARKAIKNSSTATGRANGNITQKSVIPYLKRDDRLFETVSVRIFRLLFVIS
jgi:hypothetical protein